MKKEKLEPIVNMESKEEEKQESSGRILERNKNLKEDYDEQKSPMRKR